jgi:hypothetical protein
MLSAWLRLFGLADDRQFQASRSSGSSRSRAEYRAPFFRDEAQILSRTNREGTAFSTFCSIFCSILELTGSLAIFVSWGCGRDADDQDPDDLKGAVAVSRHADFRSLTWSARFSGMHDART